MNHEPVHVGIDVSKDMLEVDPFDGKAPRVSNSPKGLQALVRRIRSYNRPVVLCCEASGGYERALIQTMLNEKIPIALVNALWVRRFAESKGLLAKTDCIDARILSSYSQQNRPRLAQQMPAWTQRLQALLVRKEDLVSMSRQEQCRLKICSEPEIAKAIRAHLRTLERHIESLRQQIRALEHDHLPFRDLKARFTQVKSIGEDIAWHFIAFMPELGLITDKQAAALVGVAPYNNDSGTHNGQRKIRRGRKRVRDKLYMGAVSAITCNPILREVYQQLVKRGKSPKVALVAVMRKQVIVLNRIAADPLFNPA